ncbi:phosphatase PAP2 family protein (plasmid) [Sphingobium sp. SJ10-10]|nr:phosphatase PAP2 family protein [Sphingobium sp. SJ10-10]MEC6698542.1 phosphatase PAP2 family protein [Sphingobium sp. SJ10-10]NML87488.1 phosphatase PAP2 family protein [Sphingobium sp. TB-6]
MKRAAACLASGSILLFCSTQAIAGARDWSRASNIARAAIVATALGVPSVQEDWDGALQAGASVGSAFLLSKGLKELIPEMRPDGTDRRSFPSTHAATSFAAAASLQNRYGWKIGLPAQLVAAFVGVARVKARKHHWGDAAAGMVIGEASGFLMTSRRDNGVRIVPWAETAGGGIALDLRF